jgi:hypothetical protein
MGAVRFKLPNSTSLRWRWEVRERRWRSSVRQAGDAAGAHPREAVGAIAFAVVDQGEFVPVRISGQGFSRGLARHFLFQPRDDLFFQHAQQARIDRPMHQEEGLAVGGVDPVVGGSAQTEALARDVVLRQMRGAPMIDSHVAVHVKRPGGFGIGRHPVLAECASPGGNLVGLAQFRQLAAQRAHFGHAIQAQHLAPLARRAVA